jgi:20S proteasome subunit beta 4
MDSIFAVAGKDYVLIASDMAVSRSILKIQDEDNKLTILSKNQVLGAAGENNARNSFSKLISGELEFYNYRFNTRLDKDEVANYTR